MKRSLMQAYVNESGKAVEFYRNAFDAELISSFPNPDGTYCHAELDIFGQILALSETVGDKCIPGNTMQFCLHLGEDQESLIRRIYDVLKDGADILTPLGPCPYSPLMTTLIDRFGINWCIFL
jgi:PhnB protein